ncbi:MAG: 2TM domain-containing protein [Acidimicrobiales bacterium]
MARHAEKSDPVETDVVVDEREAARRRVHDRREFSSDAVAYVVINAVLIVIWAVSGAGYFWPAWVLLVWGAFLVLHAWKAFVRRPMTEADIEAEMRRHRPAGR